MLVNKTIVEFIDELASASPAPGGGSTAALAGALGAALCAMVAKLTSGDKFQDVAAEVREISAAASDLKDRLLRYVDEDTAAFNKVMAAYRLPKQAAEEKERRTAAIQQALKEAADLPMAVAQACLDVLRLAVRVIKVGNPNAASDAAVAGALAYAALQGALYNVKINLSSIKDEEYTTRMKAKIVEVVERSVNANREIEDLAQAIIR
ncbi:cyclodeaminase/cyclohydrolase family protein [Sporolituus thermophilus]|uniref:Formiminotetrahydrofolate cyclodeaminase n=1 Tax=Sporolituus thermophilus DSM 23256 TaxID=1123285 RepID=A0A1G7N1S7_9FIRM|nr:cyclodeaminase/cyclohydrolase family protein [Sporolituus thermophilus]SDF67867.1 Formiminotetrahydrofolate cyclodeaminase [Sporolituus thermophilus DSM 23256]